MNSGRLKLSVFTLLLLVYCAASAQPGSAQKTTDHEMTTVPKTWVDAEIAELEIPVANLVGQLGC